MAYVELTSSKYVEQALRNEQAQWRRTRNRKAFQDFTTFLGGLIGIAIGILVVRNAEAFVPFFESVIATFS